MPSDRHRTPTTLLLGAFVLSSCASSGKEKNPAGEAVEDVGYRIEMRESGPLTMPIGQFLARTDGLISQWNQYKLTERTQSDINKRVQIEITLRNDTKARIDEVIEQLEGPSALNRKRAAGALGFSDDPKAMSPLVNALHDSRWEVISNAAMALSVLKLEDTPMERLANLMMSHDSLLVRSNSAQALRAIAERGGRSKLAIEAARAGLADAEPNVRCQSALILGLHGDSDFVDQIATLLDDPLSLVAKAAVIGLYEIARQDPAKEGRVARAILRVFDHSEGNVHATQRDVLGKLRGLDMGKEAKDWIEWADGLP